MPQILTLLKETAAEWNKDNAPRLGAALAYYSLFSIGPCLLIAVTVAGWVFGAEAVSGELFTQLRGLIGDQGASAVQALLANTHRPAAGAAGAIGIVTLILGATGVVVELKNSLNAVWEVEPKPGRGLRVFIKKYIVSLGAVMGFGFVLMVSLVLSTVVSAAGRFVAGVLPLPGWVLQLANFATLFVVVTMLIAGMFTYLPDVRLRFRTILPGAALTTVLFMVGKLLIGLYLGKVGVASTFGAAGSVVALLVWVYYSAQIIFFGAEFTEVWARHHGVKPTPEPDARRVPTAEQGMPTAGRPVPA